LISNSSTSTSKWTLLYHRVDRLYQQLRQNVLHNVIKVYQDTGYYWEQYDDQTGQGIRGHPFTGWTALTVNLFLESY
jgi:mannosyl-oligosaccharide glucosidase